MNGSNLHRTIDVALLVAALAVLFAAVLALVVVAGRLAGCVS